MGAECVIDWAQAGRRRIHLVGPTTKAVRDVQIEGESGILAHSPPWFYPAYEPSKQMLRWPNGVKAYAFTAEEPERLRGPQAEVAWCDELAAWQRAEETWDNLNFGLRLGRDPRVVITTTPKPIDIVRRLATNALTVVTRASTYENSDFLAPGFLSEIVRKYEGTRLGRQELLAELLDDVPGALWTRAMIERARVTYRPGQFRRIVVGVDPAVTAGEDSDATGIVVVGLAPDGSVWPLEDLTRRATPGEWARVVVMAAAKWRADRVVGEVNNGGDLVEANLRNAPGGSALPYRAVRASRGKAVRAEPVAALYEQGRVKHWQPLLDLEDELCSWVPGMVGERSPDRMDALVWAITDLVIAPAEAQLNVQFTSWESISQY